MKRTKDKKMMYFFHPSRKLFYIFPLWLSLLTFTFMMPTPSHASDKASGWEFHRSISGAFEVRFPKKYKQKIRTLRQTKNNVIYRNEYIAEIGNDPERYKNLLYVIKVEQTIGLPLSFKTIKRIVEAKTNEYVTGMQKNGAVLRSIKKIDQNGAFGKELFFTYEENGIDMGFRVKMVHSDVSRIEQVLTGPTEQIYSYRSNDFFESLKIFDGYSTKPGDFEKEWEKHTSPRNIYTVLTPPKNDFFNFGPFEFKKSKKVEKGEMTFKDPLLNNRTYYSTFGYKMDKPFNERNIKSFLFRNHMSKYGANFASTDKLNFNVKKYKDRIIVTAGLSVIPPKSRPYANTVYFHGTFKGQYALIQELEGNKNTIMAPFMMSLLSLVDLHPERQGKPLPKTEKKDSAQKETKKKKNQTPD